MRLQYSAVCLKIYTMLLTAVSEPRWSWEWMEGPAQGNETYIHHLCMMLKQAASRKAAVSLLLLPAAHSMKTP